jgi:hypothetical protein
MTSERNRDFLVFIFWSGESEQRDKSLILMYLFIRFYVIVNMKHKKKG